MRLGLQMHNVDQLKSVVKSRGRITPAQFTATYGPTASEVAQVTSYLQSQGLSNVVVEPNNLLVSATGSAASVGKAFNTTLNSFTLDGATVFANTTTAYVPSALNGIVVAVLGLNNAAAHAESDQRRAAAAVAQRPARPAAGIGLLALERCADRVQLA